MRFLSKFFTWLAYVATPEPVIERTYRRRLFSGIEAQLHLGTKRPRYSLIISEPLPDFIYPELNEWTASCLAEFQQLAQIEISEAEKQNVVTLTPAIYDTPPRESSRTIEEKRKNRYERKL